MSVGKNMLDTFKELGGKIEFKKKVENILHRGKSKLRSILAEKGVTSYEEFE